MIIGGTGMTRCA